MNRALTAFERLITWALVVMMALAILGATVNLVWEFVGDLVNDPFGLLTVDELIEIFGAFLFVLIGLELLETVKHYAGERRVRVEAVVLVALLAVVRKLITLDVKQLAATTLFGVAAVVLTLACAYWLMRRSDAPRPPGSAPPGNEQE